MLCSRLRVGGFGFVMSRLNGVEEEGKCAYPALFVPYYNEYFRDFMQWDGLYVDKVVFNWKSRRGSVVVYDRSGMRLEYDSLEFQNLVLGEPVWLFEWEGGDYERGLYTCTCWDDGVPPCRRYSCLASSGQGFCGIGFRKGGGCVGICPKKPPLWGECD